MYMNLIFGAGKFTSGLFCRGSANEPRFVDTGSVLVWSLTLLIHPSNYSIDQSQIVKVEIYIL